MMLNYPTEDKLRELKLTGMLQAWQEQQEMPQSASLDFEERFGLLLDREASERANRRLKTRLRRAKLRQDASLEDIDYGAPRGLDKKLMLSLAGCQWIREHHNCLITGPTGSGKSFLACALAHKACREGHTALYLRMPRLFQELAIAKGDGRYTKLMAGYAKTRLLVLDDWGMAGLTDEQRRDLFEVIEDRYDRASTLITSQVPVKNWHEVIGDPTLADAILDRLVHNAYKINLKGDSMRKKRNSLTNGSGTAT
jgi:DNA replication protein DnaC